MAQDIVQNSGVPNDVYQLDEELVNDMFKLFIDKLDENTKQKLLTIVSPYDYCLFQMNLPHGSGNKEYNKIIKIIIQGIIFRSEAIGKRDMAELWLAYKSVSRIRSNAILDNTNINQLLEKQGVAWGITAKKGVWNSVKNTLDDKGMVGILIPETKEQLDELYMSIRSKKSLDGTENTKDYITISYVQTKNKDHGQNDLMPSPWSENILDAMKIIRKLNIFKDNKHIGIWWDKLAQIQYKGSQKSWPATANLQFPTHMTLVCLPLAISKDYSSLPLWSNKSLVNSLIETSVHHISSCSACKALSWICVRDSPLVSPAMAMRCWPFMEIRLANMNVGAFITAKQMEYLINTIQALMLIWYVCNQKYKNSSSYELYAENIEYCHDFLQSCTDNICLELSSVIDDVLGNVTSDIENEIQLEFINILGFLTNVIANVTILELYIDEEKARLHPTIKKLCKNKTEYNDTDDYNRDLIKRKLMLHDWQQESIANTVNEVLSGYSHNSECYRDADKIIAALVLMDIELTQSVLQKWDPDSGRHPFIDLFTKEENWDKICRSNNMSCLLMDTPMNRMQDVSVFWMGCMQSKINGKVFMEAVNDSTIGGICLNNSVIQNMQNKLQQVFIEKINIKGHYYEGMNACLNHMSDVTEECIECSGMRRNADVIGRYTLLATRQLRGITQGIINGDTQIAIVKMEQDKKFMVTQVGNLSITFNNGSTKLCSKCNKICAMVCDCINSNPLGVVIVYYMNDEEAKREQRLYANIFEIKKAQE